MKALVMCGGVPQIELLKKLKARGISTVLVDMNEKVKAREFADAFYPVSTLDVEGVCEVAKKEKVDFLLTVCADQVLEVVAEISERLGLPCYIDHKTATDVSKKSYMKKIFVENGIPTSKHVIMKELDEKNLEGLEYPLIVKPVDSYSSRGVKRVNSPDELLPAFEDAVRISRTDTAVVEEFVEGDEITVDVYVEGGKAHVLSMSNSEKIKGNDKFVIYRTVNPARVDGDIAEKIKDVAQRIADAFGLVDSPMLIQLISDGKRVSVVEFCARTGGGIKFRLIKKVSGFDVIDAVIDLTLGNKPHFDEEAVPPKKYLVNEFIYCNPGVIDSFDGFESLKDEGIVTEYYLLKAKGAKLGEVSASSDRAACFTVEAASKEELLRLHKEAASRVKVLDKDGNDLIKRELFKLEI